MLFSKIKINILPNITLILNVLSENGIIFKTVNKIVNFTKTCFLKEPVCTCVKALTIITKRSILDVAAALDSPLEFSGIFSSEDIVQPVFSCRKFKC